MLRLSDCFGTSVSFQPYPLRHPGHAFKDPGPLEGDELCSSPLGVHGNGSRWRNILRRLGDCVGASVSVQPYPLRHPELVFKDPGPLEGDELCSSPIGVHENGSRW